MNERNRSKQKKKVRYAVVGLGYISQIAILRAFVHARENSELTALVSGNATKLQKLSRKYEIERTYSYKKFADCLHSGEIDAIYIALPNNMHRAYTEAAAQAGIHVLCEKPMAFTESDCLAMIAATEAAGIKFMTAYRLHFEQGNLHAVEAIKSGKIGDARIFSSTFSRQVKFGNSRLKIDAGGGVLYDMGVYCINAARYLFRSEPVEVFAWNLTVRDPRFKDVPEMTSGLLKFPNDRIVSFTASFGAADRSVFEVIGTKGVLKMDPAYEMAEDLKSEIAVDGWKMKEVFKKRDQFASELVHFSNCILDDTEPEPSGQEGLADVRIIEALLHSAETGKPVAVPQVKISQRPDSSQEISKEPMIRPPQLVRAASPGAA